MSKQTIEVDFQHLMQLLSKNSTYTTECGTCIRLSVLLSCLGQAAEVCEEGIDED